VKGWGEPIRATAQKAWYSVYSVAYIVSIWDDAANTNYDLFLNNFGGFGYWSDGFENLVKKEE
jgi:hypothetical protein